MLGVAQLSALELQPVAFIEAAAASGLHAVSLFVSQASEQSNFPLTTRERIGDVKAALSHEGVTVRNIECFMLTPASNVERYRSLIDLGAELGAQNLVALLYDADEQRVRDNLAQLLQLAADNGLGVGIEFMPFTPRWKTLPETLQLIESLGLPNLKVAIDCLHLIRSGGSSADLIAMPSSMISHVQLCDSADIEPSVDYFHEAGVERLAPGEGAFPLIEILQALPPDVPLELEVPRSSATPALQRLSHMAAAAEQVLQRVGGC